MYLRYDIDNRAVSDPILSGVSYIHRQAFVFFDVIHLGVECDDMAYEAGVGKRFLPESKGRETVASKEALCCDPYHDTMRDLPGSIQSRNNDSRFRVLS